MLLTVDIQSSKIAISIYVLAAISRCLNFCMFRSTEQLDIDLGNAFESNTELQRLCASWATQAFLNTNSFPVFVHTDLNHYVPEQVTNKV